MKSAPTILISPGTRRNGLEFDDYAVDLSEAYPRAVLAAGGIPWIVPAAAGEDAVMEMVHRSDGVLLTGGDDVQPGLYKRRLSKRAQATISSPDPQRDYLELLLIRETFRQRKPLLAICRGVQILNVAFGGDLIVDIPSECPQALRHNRPDLKNDLVHSVEIEPDSQLARVFGQSTVRVNSSHHQAVGRPAKPFRVTARSADGIVEAVELTLADEPLLPYLLGLQFHPERLIDRYPRFLRVFRSFTEACALDRRNRCYENSNYGRGR